MLAWTRSRLRVVAKLCWPKTAVGWEQVVLSSLRIGEHEVVEGLLLRCSRASIANRAPQKLAFGGAREAWGRSRLVGPPGTHPCQKPDAGGHELPAAPGHSFFLEPTSRHWREVKRSSTAELLQSPSSRARAAPPRQLSSGRPPQCFSSRLPIRPHAPGT